MLISLGENAWRLRKSHVLRSLPETEFAIFLYNVRFLVTWPKMQDFCKSDHYWLWMWKTRVVAVYLAVYAPLWRCFAGCLCVLLLVARCFALCAPVVCAPDRIAARQAIGVYRAGIDQGGVSSLCTAQNKKTRPSCRPSNPTRTNVVESVRPPFSWNARCKLNWF